MPTRTMLLLPASQELYSAELDGADMGTNGDNLEPNDVLDASSSEADRVAWLGYTCYI